MTHNPQHPDNANFEALITDARIIGALERKPDVRIPTNFAASVLAALPAEQAFSHTRTGRTLSYTRVIAVAAIVLLAIAVIALPLREPDAMLSWTSTGFLVEMVFAGELMALALWPGLLALTIIFLFVIPANAGICFSTHAAGVTHASGAPFIAVPGSPANALVRWGGRAMGGSSRV